MFLTRHLSAGGYTVLSKFLILYICLPSLSGASMLYVGSPAATSWACSSEGLASSLLCRKQT